MVGFFYVRSIQCETYHGVENLTTSSGSSQRTSSLAFSAKTFFVFSTVIASGFYPLAVAESNIQNLLNVGEVDFARLIELVEIDIL